MSSSPSIYISHAWGGESEIITQQIVERFKKENLNITLDKNDLGYRESITKFMENLGQADAIILVISNKYLHSEYCMFELLQIYDNKNILERIFPVVLDEVSIAKSTDRLELVKYWENQSTELETKIRELQSLGHIDGITDDLNLYYNIRNKIAKLTSILKDINTLNVGTHRDSDFSHLVSAVKKQIANKDTSTSEVEIPAINTALKTSEDIKVEDPSKKKSN
ncbi:MAG: toll/interleukin-1 receptor domain-containing protein [Saprospiraceae bacterium]|nr:toll/interleukin-1 receptor domain-containing protein [Saprospiraceae bacterium]